MTTVRERVTVLDAAITELSDRLAKLAAQEAALEAQVATTRKRLARGTEPVTEAPSTAPPASLEDAILAALAREPASPTDLAKALPSTLPKVTAALAKLYRAKAIFNLGSDVEPRWTPVVGDDAPTQVLYAAMERMLAIRPMTFLELSAATGARRGRLSGVIVQMQRNGSPITNLGTERRARWFLLPKA